MDQLTELRTQVVEIVEKEGIRLREKFRAVKFDRWQAENPDVDIAEAGHPTKMVKLQGVMTKVVLFRHLPDGHYDLELESTLESVIRETIDAGNQVLRKGQQKSKFEDARDKILGSVRKEGDKFATLEPPVPTSSRQKLAAAPTEVADEGSGADATSSEEDVGDDELQFDEGDSILASLLGDTPTPTTTPRKTGGSPPSGAPSIAGKEGKRKAAKKGLDQVGSKRSLAASSEIAPEDQSAAVPTVEDPTPKKRGRGHIDLSCDAVLASEKVPEAEQKLASVVASLGNTEAFQSVLNSPLHTKALDSSCMALMKTAKAVYQDLVLVDNKLSKRVNVPDEAGAKVRSLRQRAKAMLGLLKGVSSQSGGVLATDAIDLIMSEMKDEEVDIPRAMLVKLMKAKAFEYARAAKYSSMIEVLGKESPLAGDAEFANMNQHIIESLIQRHWLTSIDKKPEKFMSVFEHTRSLLNASVEDAVLPLSFVQDIGILIQALDPSEGTVTAKEQEAALATIQERVETTEAACILKTIGRSQAYKGGALDVLMKIISEKDDSATKLGAVSTATKELAKLSDPNAPMSKEDVNLLNATVASIMTSLAVCCPTDTLFKDFCKFVKQSHEVQCNLTFELAGQTIQAIEIAGKESLDDASAMVASAVESTTKILERVCGFTLHDSWSDLVPAALDCLAVPKQRIAEIKELYDKNNVFTCSTYLIVTRMPPGRNHIWGERG